MFGITKIKRSMINGRINELAARLKKEGIKFERYRDCCVVDLNYIAYWITPGVMSYTITNNCEQQSMEYNHIRSVISYMKTVIDLDKDL